MLAIISVINFVDMQTHIVLFSVLISVFFKIDGLVSGENVIIIGFGLDHLATLVRRSNNCRGSVS
jgi:hypothetical protein